MALVVGQGRVGEGRQEEEEGEEKEEEEEEEGEEEDEEEEGRGEEGSSYLKSNNPTPDGWGRKKNLFFVFASPAVFFNSSTPVLTRPIGGKWKHWNP